MELQPITQIAAKAGIPIPSKLRDTLEQLTKEKGETHETNHP